MDIYPNFRQTVIPRITSDHFPVLDTSKLLWGLLLSDLRMLGCLTRFFEIRFSGGGIMGLAVGGKDINL